MYAENWLIFAGMKPDQIVRPAHPVGHQRPLQEQVQQLRSKLEALTAQVNAFEALLQSHLINEIIEEQELSILYKEQKAEKKAKRLAQKKKGKNYVEPVGLLAQKQPSTASAINPSESKEKKRLYREAMLHVHPDKFSMNADKVDVATSLTTRLVEIYKQEDLATLVAFHAHLLNNAGLTKDATHSSKVSDSSVAPDAYLLMEKAQLEKALDAVKSKHSYHVLTTYEDPSSFIEELKAYYQDRIQKLKRRTRRR